VSSIINIIREHEARFAIRSGGHTLNAGHANIEGGVTINLGALTTISVNAAGTQVSIGAGLRWGDVYKRLDKLGLAVPGGRVADVGVGGLNTGGTWT
jgi:FAD/FMN-containing dehydrogenase